MKSILLLLSTLFIFMSTGMAQSSVVKIGIPALLHGRANLNYEYVLNEKLSLNLRAGAQFPRNFPVNSDVLQDGTEDFRIETGKWRAFGFTPSLRIYFGKNNPAPQGFYVSPYIAVNRNSINFDMEYDDGNNQNIDANFKVGLTGVGGGVMIGNQWVINESFVIDFNYFGLGYGVQNIGMKFTSSDTSVDYEQVKEDLEDELENTNNTGNISEIEVLDDGIRVKASAPSLQFRFSLSLGYMF